MDVASVTLLFLRRPNFCMLATIKGFRCSINVVGEHFLRGKSTGTKWVTQFVEKGCFVTKF